MPRTPKTSDPIVAASHLPRTGLYALIDRWRARDHDAEEHAFGRLSKDEQHDWFTKRWARREALDACADELERAIAHLPVDRQHLEAMVQFEQQTAVVVGALDRIVTDLKVGQDSVNGLVKALLLRFDRAADTAREVTAHPSKP